jgi:hypothetical protein
MRSKSRAKGSNTASTLPSATRPWRANGARPTLPGNDSEQRARVGSTSQTQLASLIGRSQGQPANALRGHDPISGAAVNRLREVLSQKGN